MLFPRLSNVCGRRAQQLISYVVIVDGDPILGEFMVKFASVARTYNVSAPDLYSALLSDAEEQATDWNLQGRQINVWKQYSAFYAVLQLMKPCQLTQSGHSDFIPQDIYEPGGAPSKQVSRTLEVRLFK